MKSGIFVKITSLVGTPECQTCQICQQVFEKKTNLKVMKKTGKKWLGLHFNPEEEKSNGSPPTLTLPGSDLNLKPQNRDISLPKKRPFNFHQRLKPKTVPDLAVHAKKIVEVESWLQIHVCKKTKRTQTAQFLLITGPTGSGKTATVQVLAKSMGLDVSEWANPMDQDFEVFRGPNQVTKFVEFLTEAKWKSLFSSSDKKIILVEEFPNALVRNPEDFGDVLEECFYKANLPVVFICTDSFDGKNLSEKLFTQGIRDKYQIAQISFNACATTLLKGALKRAHNLVQDNLDLFKTPSPNTINAIISTAMGDIKCAMNQYYFASLLGTSDLPEVVSKPGMKRKRNQSSSSIKAMSRDENLGLFHGIGRVLNPKRIEIKGSWRLHCDIEKLIDEFSTQPGIFTAFLFENYIKYYGDVNDACHAVEILSLSQTFLEKWVDRGDILTFALWISVLGLMVHNEHRVSRWNPITGPKKVIKKTSVDPNAGKLPATDLYYYNIINKVENARFRVY